MRRLVIGLRVHAIISLVSVNRSVSNISRIYCFHYWICWIMIHSSERKYNVETIRYDALSNRC